MFREGLLCFFLITNIADDTVNLFFNYSSGMFIVATSHLYESCILVRVERTLSSIFQVGWRKN